MCISVLRGIGLASLLVVLSNSVALAGGVAKFASPVGSGIEAELVVVESPGRGQGRGVAEQVATGLTVTGVGSGFDPAEGYITLLYSTNDCTMDMQLFVGTWNVQPNGVATLHGVHAGPSFETISASIRLDTFALQACGQIH